MVLSLEGGKKEECKKQGTKISTREVKDRCLLYKTLHWRVFWGRFCYFVIIKIIVMFFLLRRWFLVQLTCLVFCSPCERSTVVSAGIKELGVVGRLEGCTVER